jgi:D-alanyl-lipoteichoic acid acyltransferase DltB (MBOAT superfamily)
MLFTSLDYFVFFAVITVAHFLLPFQWRPWLLLAGSYFFYMRWRWEYGLLLFGVSLVNYLAGRLIARTDRAAYRQLWLVAALCLSFGTLAIFKYYNFFNDAIRYAAQSFRVDYNVPRLDVLLPVGISFFTFQAIGYTIDVYRRTCAAEKRLSRFCLFTSFFPQLLAGPIARAGNLMAQFDRRDRLDPDRLSSGAKLIIWGLFKKIVIADNLATYVARVYDSPSLYSGTTLLLATYFFAFQIYCDFSGYSDIAIGSTRILGYDLMQNFRLPYLADSIRDFWRRWHISLSSWFADYLYIPLGGNRVPLGRWVFNILVVFLVSGLWHGAGWTFIVWGALHGVYYLTESLWDRFGKPHFAVNWAPPALVRPVKVVVTFHLVLIAWVFFRARTLSDAFLIVQRVFTDLGGSLYLGPSQLATFVCGLLILLLLFVQLLQTKGLVVLYQGAPRLPRLVRWPAYLLLLHGMALLGRGANQFIYFQF